MSMWSTFLLGLAYYYVILKTKQGFNFLIKFLSLTYPKEESIFVMMLILKQ